MNPWLARFLTRLYPPAWRDRYGAEFEAFLEEGRGDLGTPLNVAWSALRERVSRQGLSKEQDFSPHRVNWWWARTPSAIFCLVPMLMLAAAYVIACLILWVGWRMFLPGYASPFGARSHGFANLYFQAGKCFYFAAPVLVSWWFEFISIRLRLKAVWLTIGLLLLAWMGVAVRIQADRGTVHGGIRHISMNFAFWSLIPNAHDGILHASTILLLAAFPYLLRRLQRTRTIC
jgi:uncharacterized membrane protein